jgi:hypothetical protein
MSNVRAILAKHEAARVYMLIHVKKAETMNTKVGRDATKFDMPKKIVISSTVAIWS